MSGHYGERYECVLQPGDTWMIWDRLQQQPASHDGTPLLALDRAEAVSLCLLMNAEDPGTPRRNLDAANDR
jgi:hypothetical protein